MSIDPTRANGFIFYDGCRIPAGCENTAHLQSLESQQSTTSQQHELPSNEQPSIVRERENLSFVSPNVPSGISNGGHPCAGEIKLAQGMRGIEFSTQRGPDGIRLTVRRVPEGLERFLGKTFEGYPSEHAAVTDVATQMKHCFLNKIWNNSLPYSPPGNQPSISAANPPPSQPSNPPNSGDIPCLMEGPRAQDLLPPSTQQKEAPKAQAAPPAPAKPEAAPLPNQSAVPPRAENAQANEAPKESNPKPFKFKRSKPPLTIDELRKLVKNDLLAKAQNMHPKKLEEILRESNEIRRVRNQNGKASNLSDPFQELIKSGKSDIEKSKQAQEKAKELTKKAADDMRKINENTLKAKAANTSPQTQKELLRENQRLREQHNRRTNQARAQRVRKVANEMIGQAKVTTGEAVNAATNELKDRFKPKKIASAGLDSAGAILADRFGDLVNCRNPDEVASLALKTAADASLSAGKSALESAGFKGAISVVDKLAPALGKKIPGLNACMTVWQIGSEFRHKDFKTAVVSTIKAGVEGGCMYIGQALIPIPFVGAFVGKGAGNIIIWFFS